MVTKIKCSCINCKCEIDSCNLNRHYLGKKCKSLTMQPSNCLFCQSTLPPYRKFCNSSCVIEYHRINNPRVLFGYTENKHHRAKFSCLFCCCEIGIHAINTHNCQKGQHTSSIYASTKVRYKHMGRFKFDIYEYKEWFKDSITLLESIGWYLPSNRGNNLTGASKDHMLSLTEGYNSNIDVKIISHPANCMLMSHALNSSKGQKSSISAVELYKRIDKFADLYGEQYRIRTDVFLE